MKNIEKKWMLFLLATFVTFFGIGYTLLKETFATTDINNTSQVTNTNDNVNDEDGMDAGDIVNTTDSCNVVDLILSEGILNFDPEVMEYTVMVSNVDDFFVNPILESSSASYVLTTRIVDDGKIIELIVTSISGKNKTYTIKAVENVNVSTPDVVVEEKKNDYTYIFIAIICVLVLINIYRIVKNKRSK